MWSEILLACFCGAIISLDDIPCWQIMISQPLIAASLIGLILGDFQVGIFMGVLFQLLWIGKFPIGGVLRPDAATASISATAMIIIAQKGTDVPLSFFPAVLGGLIFGIIGAKLDVQLRRFNSRLSEKADFFLQRKQEEKLTKLNLWGIGLFWLKNFLYLLVSISIGTLIISKLALRIPQPNSHFFLQQGLLLLGLTVIISIFISRKRVWFLIAGLLVGLVFKLLIK
jgi:mannose/fructose/N-acetylgalactosamine-specific phosphotransferase system component IIC